MLQTQKRETRENKILSSLEKMQYATREQLQKVEDLAGDRNAHRILKEMEDDKLIQSVRKECKIYSLANKGRERIGATGSNLTGRMMEHSLMRNDLYIMLGMPSNWTIEEPIAMPDGSVSIVCDAMFLRGNEYHFVEVDHAQAMQRNYEKIDQYKILSRGIWETYKHRPTIIYFTANENRKKRLEAYMREKGVKGEVYTR